MTPLNMTPLNRTFDSKRTGRDPWAIAVRGCMGGFLVVVSLLGLLWVLGLIPETLTKTIFAAVLVSSLICSVGTVFKAYALTSSRTGRTAGQVLQVAIFGDLVLHLAVLGGVLLSMHWQGAEPSSRTSFALAYAPVVFVFPLVATLIISKRIQDLPSS